MIQQPVQASSDFNDDKRREGESVRDYEWRMFLKDIALRGQRELAEFKAKQEQERVAREEGKQ